MTTPVEVKPNNDRDLILCRIIDAPRERVFAAFANPES